MTESDSTAATTAPLSPPLTPPLTSPLSPPLTRAPRKPTLRFMLSHPAHVLALGFGSGLSPVAPGTVGTLWAWLSFLILQPRLTDLQWAVTLAVGLVVGIWACAVTARHMAVADPGAIVWDEIIAFWAVLWLVTPAGFAAQLVAFALFRFFDAAKPGPVAWADGLFKVKRGQAIGWRQGFGIMFDDAVAALCTLMVIAIWKWL